MHLLLGTSGWNEAAPVAVAVDKDSLPVDMMVLECKEPTIRSAAFLRI